MAKERSSISVCMIARDEESCIADALRSVRDLADEMIVVDTGSADGTALEAKRCGARVHTVRWTNDFSEARNVALSKARCRWILVLDADECLAPADHEAIREIVRGDVPTAYLFEQRTYVRDDDGFACVASPGACETSRGAPYYFVDRQVRLFRNEPFMRYAREIHENLDESLLAAGVPLRDSGIAVHHYGRLSGGRVHRKALAWHGLGRGTLEAYGANPRYLYEMAVQFLDLGLLEAAAEHVKTALAAEPSSWRLWNLAGLVHLRSGERERAASCFRAALGGSGGNAEISNNLGAALMENGEPAEALLWFERALALERDNPDILRNAASACLLVGEPDRAAEYVERSLAIDPFAAHSHVIHADILHRRGDDAGAVRVIERMRFLPDAPFKTYLKAIHLCTRMHMIDEADALIRRAVDAYPHREDLLYLAGKIAELKGEDDRAVSIYRLALAARPDHAEMLSSLGCIFDRQDRLAEALAAFREALRCKPECAQIEVNLGIVYDKLGRLDEADGCFARAMERGEHSSFAYNALGCHHARSSRYEEAHACFAKAVELESDNALYLQNLGLACEKMRFFGKAAEVYEKMAHLDPQAAVFARERLGRLCGFAVAAAR